MIGNYACNMNIVNFTNMFYDNNNNNNRLMFNVQDHQNSGHIMPKALLTWPLLFCSNIIINNESFSALSTT